MIVRVLCFAAIQDVVGREAIEIALPAGSTVAALWDRLAAEHPALCPWRVSARVAVNAAYAADTAVIAAGDEVALIPPVAGG
ncbi:MAG: MoaD/ThiS family protein [Deltaproteobacteria bacterium]|nr:MoaD/ThiS family protein [Deltaproteobacteria bacterium]